MLINLGFGKTLLVAPFIVIILSFGFYDKLIVTDKKLYIYRLLKRKKIVPISQVKKIKRNRDYLSFGVEIQLENGKRIRLPQKRRFDLDTTDDIVEIVNKLIKESKGLPKKRKNIMRLMK